MTAAILFAVLAFQDPASPDARPNVATPREKARRLLDSTVETAASASPEVAACALLYVGENYDLFDHKKAVEYLKLAFAATAAIPPGSDLRRNSLQARIATATAPIDMPSAIAMLQQIQPADAGAYDPRTFAINTVVSRLISKSQFDAAHVDQAVELIDSTGATGQYPFSAARQIFEKLPVDEGRRLSIFGNAMSAYALRPNKGFADFLARHWRELPQSMAQSALGSVIANILKGDDQESYTLNLSSEKGSVNFHSSKDADLFDLMHAVRAMDPKHADEILDSRSELKAALRRFPEGSLGMGESINHSSTSGGGTDPAEQQRMALNGISNSRAMQAMAAMAVKDLSKAVSIAKTIPAPEKRAEILSTLAGVAAASDPGTAKSAISECIDALQDLKDPGVRAASWSNIAEAAHRAGDEKLAGEAIGHALDDGAELYKRDIDADQPNDALRDEWPSTNAYRHAVISAVKIMGVNAESLLLQIADNDLALFARVEIAQALLERPHSNWSTSVSRHKR